MTISLALRHPKWGPLALPLQAMLYVRRKTMAYDPSAGVIGGSLRSSNWRHDWWSGSFPS